MSSPTARRSFYDATELDEEWRPFVQEQITSLSRWDSVRYFLEIGEEPATLDQVALACGRDSAALIDDLGALTSLGWLVRRRTPADETVYQLTQSDEGRQRLDAFHSAMQEDDFRIKVLYQWTRGRLVENERSYDL